MVMAVIYKTQICWWFDGWASFFPPLAEVSKQVSKHC